MLRRVGAPLGVLAVAALVALPRVLDVPAGTLPPIPVAVGVLAAWVVAGLLVAENWYAMTVAAGGTGAGRGVAYRVHVVGQLARYVAPGGQIPARAALARRHGLRLADGMGMGAVELALGIGGLALLSAATLPSWLGAWVQAGSDSTGLRVVAVVASVLLGLLLVAVLVRPELIGRLPRVLGGTWPPGTARQLGLRYLAGLAIRAAAFAWLVAASTPAVGTDVPVVGAAVGAVAIGNLIGRLAVVAPAGLGVREGGITLVLAPVVGLGPAVLVAAVSRVLDVVSEALLVVGVLAVTDGMPAGSLRAGSTLVLDDGSAVAVGLPVARTWSRVAPGDRAGRAVFCKQLLDARRRPDPAAVEAVRRAADRATGAGLPAVPVLATCTDRAVVVLPWVQAVDVVADWDRPGGPDRILAAVRSVLTQLTERPERPSPGSAPVTGERDGPVLGLDAIAETGPGTVVLRDLPDRTGGPADCAAMLVASTLALRWGRPLRGFLAGPPTELAGRVLDEAAGVLGHAPTPAAIEQAWRMLWRPRVGEWVGPTPLAAAVRFAGVHTLGVAYHRQVLRWVRALPTARRPDLVVPEPVAGGLAPAITTDPGA